MVKIKNTRVYGLEESVKRSGYPMRYEEPVDYSSYYEEGIVGDKDYKRAKSLGSVPSGAGHDNFLKGIVIQFDLRYPLYFTKQIQRYHFIDFISSSSTMHTITKRGSIDDYVNKYVLQEIVDIVNQIIWKYNETTDEDKRYEYFMKIISNLPSGFELWAGMTTNYLQLKNIYLQRKNHKLKEDWGYFCSWIESLPMFNHLVLGER